MMTLIVFLQSYGWLLLHGLAMTLALWISALIISSLIGIPCGIFSSEMVRKDKKWSFIMAYVFFVRAVPVYVQILIGYFVIPELFACTITPFMASVGALGICSSGYMAEIIRCGINSLPKGQWESAFVLGYSRLQTIVYIITPQTIRAIIPAFFNELESLIKSTSIVSVVGVMELTKVAHTVVARTMQPMPMYAVIVIAYLTISFVVNSARILIEKRFFVW